MVDYHEILEHKLLQSHLSFVLEPDENYKLGNELQNNENLVGIYPDTSSMILFYEKTMPPSKNTLLPIVVAQVSE